MKKRLLILALLLALSYSLNAFAVNAPMVGNIPSTVFEGTYTLKIYTEDGATVSVVGGPSQLAPMTDGQDGDDLDGVLEVMVGLTENAVTNFSITASLDGDISDTLTVKIKQETPVPSGDGDSDAPDAPVLGEIPVSVDTAEYLITGQAEPDTNINVYNTDGEKVASTSANEENGYFAVKVDLEEQKTNRFNVTAEDQDGNEGDAVQAVIRQTVDLPDMPDEEPEEPELESSAQIFFSDVDGHWAEDFIYQLAEDDVVSGKSDGIFAPNAFITRAELTKIAILAFGHSVNTSVKEHPFGDVPLNSWYAPYVEEAKRLEIVSGYPSGGFGPNDFIDRAAALKIILLAAGLNIESNLVNEFDDVADDAWFASYVKFAAGMDIVSGYGDGRFGPGDNITRAQVAKVVIRALELKGQ